MPAVAFLGYSRFVFFFFFLICFGGGALTAQAGLKLELLLLLHLFCAGMKSPELRVVNVVL